MNTHKHIIVVDDDADDLTLIQDTFTEVAPDIKVHLFASAKDFLSFASGNNSYPMLIVIDYNMPEMTGSELLVALRVSGLFAGIPKVICSTADYAKYIEQTLSNGATRYFIKPTNYNDCLLQAKEMIDIGMQSLPSAVDPVR